MRIRQVFAGILIFAVGVAAGRTIFAPQQSENSEGIGASFHSQSQSTGHPASLAVAGLTSKAAASSEMQSLARDAQVHPLTSPTIHRSIEVPKDSGSYLDAEREQQVQKLVQDALPTGTSTGPRNKTGGVATTSEAAPDGGVIYRIYNDQDILIGETWKQASGDELSRNYYDNGPLKSVYWKSSDQGTTSISFTQSGIYKSRYDQLPDGTKYSTDYDDEGQIIAVFKTDPSGKTTRLR